MAKRGSWYFEGYESEPVLDDRGGSKNVLVYRGAWYGLGLEPGALLRYKLVCAALAVVMTAAFLLVSFFPVVGGMTPWVGGVCLLGLVPLAFSWIGLVNFLLAREEWELRVFYAGWRRLKRWNIAFLALMAFSLGAELVFMARYPALAGGEVPYLLGLIVCAACPGLVLGLQLRRPAKVVRGPDVR